MRRGTWVDFSEKQRSGSGAYFDRARFPKLEAQSDDFLVDVVVGDTPVGLAQKHYGDRRLYWAILERNGLSDPIIDLAPGISLVFSSLRYLQERILAYKR